MCISKVPVRNKKDGTYTYRPCGKCIECMNVKSLKYSNLLQNEFQRNESVEAFLVTLKYTNKTVPLIRIHRKKITDVPTEREYLPFRNEHGEFISRHNIKSYDVCLFMAKTQRVKDFYGSYVIDSIDAYTDEQKKKLTHLLLPITTGKVKGTKFATNFLPDNTFPILFHRDVQLYVKRVRDKIHTSLKQLYKGKNKKLTDYEKEKIKLEMSRIKVFYTGEYGPQSFRPHYHVLFFHDSPRISAIIAQILSSSWSLGSVDIERCDSAGAGKYVSEYCNSFVSLPNLYKFSWSQPKAFHSIRIGVDESKEFTKDIREVSFESIRAKIISRNGSYQPSVAPSSLETYLFPKTYRFNQSDDCLLLARFTLYNTITAKTNLTQVKDIISYYCDEKIGAMLSNPHPFFSNSQLFFHSENVVSTFRAMLYTSRRFLKNCDRYHITPYHYLRLIKKYYEDKESFSLRQFYEDLSFDSEQIPIEHQINYYDNVMKDDVLYDTTNLLTMFAEQGNLPLENCHFALHNENYNKLLFSRRQKLHKIINDKIKHKSLNDKNIIFIEYE